MKNLVIVESPTKAKIIKKFLGKDYSVESSNGHVRDLPSKKADLPKAQQKLPYATLAVNVEKDFEPLYVITPAKKKRVQKIKSLMDENTKIWIATDEDREGEAIGWHLLEILKPQKTNEVQRIVFHEITKDAILKSLQNPRQIDIDLVNAQQARRILDRLVGYKLSPFLWSKIRFGLSAGRVQSAAVKVIVDREKEIQAFNPEEYWTINAELKKEKFKEIIEANLHKINKKKPVLGSQTDSDQVLKDLEKATYKVEQIEEKEVQKNPAPPFTTSTLQQEAARKLGFSVKKTMMVAQRLYEGKDFGEKESAGLITYMRTDSVNLSETALIDAKKAITKEFGAKYALAEPRIYKTKSKGAQEAHEAIRPTVLTRKPEDLKIHLEADEYKLYKLIWKRTLATQMTKARFNRIAVDIDAENSTKNKYTFRVNGQTVIFDGFMRVYLEGTDDAKDESKYTEKILPEFKKGEILKLNQIVPTQHFTKPPARYTEASLVKKMEEEGVGRPSTYAPTITTIIARGYVDKEAGQLKPTDTAFVVTDVLEKHFNDIVDIHFTAKMENHLDKIAEGTEKWIPWLHEFYDPFAELVAEKTKTVQKQEVVSEATEEICEECGEPMVIKLSRFGKFLSCSGYPKCKNAKPLDEDLHEDKELEAKYADEKCPKCKKQMLIKSGRFGKFLACENYPKCKTTKAIIKSTEVKCPDCKTGEIIERHSKKGKVFYGCSTYPDCKFALWKKPVKKKCPQCKGLMTEKNQKVLQCETCKFEEDREED